MLVLKFSVGFVRVMYVCVVFVPSFFVNRFCAQNAFFGYFGLFGGTSDVICVVRDSVWLNVITWFTSPEFSERGSSRSSKYGGWFASKNWAGAVCSRLVCAWRAGVRKILKKTENFKKFVLKQPRVLETWFFLLVWLLKLDCRVLQSILILQNSNCFYVGLLLGTFSV